MGLNVRNFIKESPKDMIVIIRVPWHFFLELESKLEQLNNFKRSYHRLKSKSFSSYLALTRASESIMIKAVHTWYRVFLKKVLHKREEKMQEKMKMT